MKPRFFPKDDKLLLLSLGMVECSYLKTDVSRAKGEKGGVQVLHGVASVKGLG